MCTWIGDSKDMSEPNLQSTSIWAPPKLSLDLIFSFTSCRPFTLPTSNLLSRGSLLSAPEKI